MQVLKAAGAQSIWFGIETLNSRLLGLLPKGCTAQQAIQVLRWSQELGIRPTWKMLFGICGERPEDYLAMAALLPLLSHLKPPSSCFPLSIKRFSSYFLNALEFGLDRLRAKSAYACIFPLPPEEVQDLAYYFDCDYSSGDPVEIARPARDVAETWMALWDCTFDERPRLDLYWAGRSSLLVVDTRPCAVRSAHRLEGLAAEVYLRCDAARGVRGLARDLVGRTGEDTIRETLRTLVDAKLTWHDDNRYLSLAIFRNRERLLSAASPQQVRE